MCQDGPSGKRASNARCRDDVRGCRNYKRERTDREKDKDHQQQDGASTLKRHDYSYADAFGGSDSYGNFTTVQNTQRNQGTL
mmetsp:Transcript_484/g.1457  ORF Transcript_484/g.1457 Transcript_484/m.1457 type:complete len:82 (-) Transcript_484:123-368(-)